jgi:hypothetical protein
MPEGGSQWHRRLGLRVVYLVVSFSVINYLYSKHIYDLNNFLRDHPSFPMAFIPNFVIPFIYPIVFLIPVFIYEELKIKHPKYQHYHRREMILFGQLVISILFFGFLYYMMIYTPGYPSMIDRNQIISAFVGYSLSVFITMGILGSDELKDIIQQIVGIKKI